MGGRVSQTEHRLPGSRIGVLVLNGPRRIYAPQQIHATIAHYLDRSRFRVFVAIPPDFEDPQIWQGNPDVTLWHFPFGESQADAHGFAGRARALFRVGQLMAGLIPLAARMRAENIRIIHTDAGPRDILAGIGLSRLTGAALVIHLHETRQGPDPWWRKLAFREAKTIFAVSEASRRSFVAGGNAPSKKIQVLHNGIDVERFRPDLDGRRVRQDLGVPSGAKVVLLAGRLVPWKGQAELLRAVALLRQRHQNIFALLAGGPDGVSPDFPTRLRELIPELGIQDRVVMANYRRDDMPEVMAAADVVAVPSYDEPFGLVVLEAMACGRPVVGSTSGAIPEIVEDGVSGLLVPPRDPAALADAIERFLVDANLRNRTVENARQRVIAEFSRERMVANVARMYEALLEPRRVMGTAVTA